jgi:glycosyltransferase involved in cell wall biosynthesis
VTFGCIVAGSHLRYDGVWQRPHHVLSRLAAHVPVLFVEEPFLAAADAQEFRAFGQLEVLRPKRRDPAAAPLDEMTLDAVRAWVGERSPLLWLYTPMMNELFAAFSEAPVVFDCMDELSAFAFAPPDLALRERDLLERARLVFAGGRSLYERRRRFGNKVRLYPSGVEFDHFARATGIAPHPLCVPLAHPIAGYTGVIDERIDIGVLEALAERAVEVVLVGPIAKIDPAILPRRTNVHFTGWMPYRELPRLLAGFDVAIMPFARNAATANISPTKTPEYLAAGKPVVSTPIADVVADYGDVVTIADGARAFAEACLDAASGSDATKVARGIARARNAGWDALVLRMWNDLKRE